MKIAGICPLTLVNDTKIQHAVPEPYGLEMILAMGKQAGHDVELFLPLRNENGDAVAESEESFLERISQSKPDVAAFSLYTCQYPRGKRIAQELKNRFPGIINVAGNRYPTFLRDVENPFDFFVHKEGEMTFRELLGEIENGRDYERVRGISFVKDGKVVNTGDRERNLDLDSLPDALRDSEILSQAYRGVSIPPLSSNPHYAVVESSRCCYNNCKFCDNGGFWGNRVVFRGAERVVSEMEKLKSQGVGIFYFMDLNFTSNPVKTRELCDLMMARNLNASWYCMSNTSSVVDALESDPGFLHRMKQAGCFKIAWGVESTSDSALEIMNKRVKGKLTTNEVTGRALQSAADAGIVNQGFYIIGFPWETEESIYRDAQQLKNLPLHVLNVGIFTPIPLSRFYGDMKREGYSFDSDLERHDRNTLVYNHPTLSNDSIKALQNRIYREFYATPQYALDVLEVCKRDTRLMRAFNEYFKFMDKNGG